MSLADCTELLGEVGRGGWSVKWAFMAKRCHAGWVAGVTAAGLSRAASMPNACGAL
jgi:hypothetical protein